MKSKYPGNHFVRYIERCISCGDVPRKRELAEQAQLFLKVEGYAELKCLIEEINLISENNDWQTFERETSEHPIYLTKKQLEHMAKAAIRVYQSVKLPKAALKIEETNNTNYINEYVEWQEHQFDRGFYTGGNVPPALTTPGKPKLLRRIVIVMGLLSLTMFAISVFINFDFMQSLPTIIILTFFAGLILVLTISDRKRSKSTRERTSKTSK